MVEITHPDIEAYLLRRCSHRSRVLDEMEALAAQRDFPIVGPLVGQLLYLLTKLHKARRIFEMGSGFGYSTYWFARALGAGGRVTFTDHDEANKVSAEKFLTQAGLAKRVKFRVGDAVELLAKEPAGLDALFVDMDKERYPRAYDLALKKLKPGGLLLADNLLWFGQVLGPARDAATKGIQTFTKKLFEGGRFSASLVPLRDGLAIARLET